MPTAKGLSKKLPEDDSQNLTDDTMIPEVKMKSDNFRKSFVRNHVRFSLVLGLVAVVFFGFALFQYLAPEKLKPFKTEQASANETYKDSSNSAKTLEYQLKDGKISGKLIYPSDDGLPRQKVCAQNTITSVLTCVDGPNLGPNTFEIVVPEGNYQVYSDGIYDKYNNNKYIKNEQKAYFNKYVTECLIQNTVSGNCDGNNIPEFYHTTINTVKVEPGGTTENVSPWDWYYVPENYSAKSQTKATTLAANMRMYTNQYFPDFKLVYDNSWKLETSTAPVAGLKSLVQRNIELTKNNSKINFNLRPQPVSGCGLGIEQPEYKLETKFPNGVSKYILQGGPLNLKNQVVYVKVTEPVNVGQIVCDIRYIKTNILTADTDGYYKDSFKNDNYVKYTTLFDITGGLNSNNPLISEMDKIVADSTFE